MSAIIDENTMVETFGAEPNTWKQFKLKILQLLSKKVDVSGGVMDNTPTDDLGVATKGYADKNIKYVKIQVSLNTNSDTTSYKIGSLSNWNMNDVSKYICLAKGGVTGNVNVDYEARNTIFNIGEKSGRIGLNSTSTYCYLTVQENGEVYAEIYGQYCNCAVDLFLIPAETITLIG